MSLGAQNMKTGPDARGIAEDVSGSAKHKNGTRRPRYRRKRVGRAKHKKLGPTPSVLPSVPPKMSSGAQNMKTEPEAPIPSKTSLGAQNMESGHDALGTVENKSRNTKRANGTRRPLYRQKRI
jgi:hypothetical protein